jgi:drug/metabolite transporter (DMT)-like permease
MRTRHSFVAAGVTAAVGCGAIVRLEGSSLLASVVTSLGVAVVFGYLWFDEGRKSDRKRPNAREPASLQAALLKSMILPALLLAGAIQFRSAAMAIVGLGLAIFWIAFLLWTRDRSAGRR